MTTLLVMDDGLNTNLIGETLHINTSQTPLTLNQTSSSQSIDNTNITPSTPTIAATTNSTSTSKKKQHNCPFCDRSFTRPYRLNDHISFSHTDERKYLCLTCSKNFSCKDKLKAHIEVKHDNKRPHVKKKPKSAANTIDDKSEVQVQPPHLRCNFPGCTKVFANKYNVKRHIENVHLKLRHSKSKNDTSKLMDDSSININNSQMDLSDLTEANLNQNSQHSHHDPLSSSSTTTTNSNTNASITPNSQMDTITSHQSNTNNNNTIHVKSEDTYMLTTSSDGQSQLIQVVTSSDLLNKQPLYQTNTIQLISNTNGDYKSVDLNSLLMQCEPKIEVMDIVNDDHHHHHQHQHNLHHQNNNNDQHHHFNNHYDHLYTHQQNHQLHDDTNSSTSTGSIILQTHQIQHQQQQQQLQDDDKNSKIYTCARCPEMFNSSNLLRKHVAEQHEKEYECCICNMNFNNRFTLLKHKKYHLKLLEQKKKNVENFYDLNTLYKRSLMNKPLLQSEIIKFTKNGILSCEKCKKCYSCLYKYRIHIKKCQVKHELKTLVINDDNDDISNDSSEIEIPRNRPK